MTDRGLSSLVAVLILFGHLGLIPMIMLYNPNISIGDRLDLLLIVGPMTAAYMSSVTQYVTQRTTASVGSSPAKADFLLVLFSVVLTVSFLGGAYGVLFIQADVNSTLDAEMAKKYIGGIELLVGVSFSIIFKRLFGGT